MPQNPAEPQPPDVVFSSPFSCSPAPAVWPRWPSAAPSSSAPAPPGRPPASVAARAACVGPLGAALAGPDAAESGSSGWLEGSVAYVDQQRDKNMEKLLFPHVCTTHSELERSADQCVPVHPMVN